MDDKELDLNNDILDPLELNEENQNSGYVPRFERDLAKMGSLEALSEAKKAENEQNAAVITEEAPEDSYEAPEEEYEEEFEEEYDPLEEVYNREEAVNSYSAENEDNPHYQYHTKPVTEEPAAETRRAKSLADFAREAEEKERLAQKETPGNKFADRGLEDVHVSADMLSDMGYSERKNTAENIRRQMEMDDLAMEMGDAPKLEEMSTEYAPTQKRAEDLVTKSRLDREEKQLMKERLEKEINKRPEGYSKKASLEMYNTLMREQKIKRAQKGFVVTVMLVAMGIITAVVTYFKLNWNNSQLFMYLSYATAAFSILLMIKVKAVKSLSCVFFAVNTILLIGPGAVQFTLETGFKPNTYIETLVFFIIAIALSAIICIQLCTNANIDTYYTTNIAAERRKAAAAAKAKQSARPRQVKKRK
ncbi:MAG: hypothetical protein ACI4J6_07755 [Oscillospiraceae bacterium]